MSLKYKLLLLLVGLNALTLGLFFTLATGLFQQDKIAYIFESSTSHSRNLSDQIATEVSSKEALLKSLQSGLNVTAKSFDARSQKVFEDSSLYQVLVFSSEVNEKIYKVAELTKKIRSSIDPKNIETRIAKLAPTVASYGVGFDHFEENERGYFIFGQRFIPDGANSALFLFSVSDGNGFIETIARSSVYRSFVIFPDGHLALAGDDFDKSGSQLLNDIVSSSLLSEVGEKDLPQGATEIKSQTGKTLLASYSQIHKFGLLVVSIVEKDLALSAMKMLFVKALLFFIALSAMTIIVSVFASTKITSNLKELTEGARKIGEGHFDLSLPVRSHDEVGALAESFNKMAVEVARLMKDNIGKARMEKELETARLVQETLFPAKTSTMGNFEVSGFYEPASECGGDWWYYFVIESKIYLFIGDATGHGASAALITSAARSAASLIEQNGKLTPGEILKILNRAIFDTSKGKIQMTFFVSLVDQKKGILTYANASHDPPFLIRAKGGLLKKRDLEPLMEVNGPRLGEGPGGEYQEKEIILQKDDCVIFYTDGLFDIRNSADIPWEEGGFLRALLTSVDKSRCPSEVVNLLTEAIRGYRGPDTLRDDVTFFVLGPSGWKPNEIGDAKVFST